MDDIPARQKALAEAMGADKYGQLMKGSGETFVSIDSNLFAVSPRMSYVAKATADQDPEFWNPKPEAAAKPKEKAGQ